MQNLQETINAHPNFMVKKEGCPFCEGAISELKKRNVKYTTFDSVKDSSLADEIKKAQSHFTFPMIFLDRKFIGGFSELKKYYNIQ
jgi:glutaredoxin 3